MLTFSDNTVIISVNEEISLVQLLGLTTEGNRLWWGKQQIFFLDLGFVFRHYLGLYRNKEKKSRTCLVVLIPN